MVKGVKVTTFILSLTVSAVGWVLARRPRKDSVYQIPEFITKYYRAQIGPQYEFLYRKLQEIGKQDETLNPIISSKIKQSLQQLECRPTESCEPNQDVDRLVDNVQVDFWASYLGGFYSYSLSFYEDLILNTFILLSSDPKSKRELMSESLWKGFFLFDNKKVELQHSKFLLPMLKIFGNLCTLTEGSKLVENLGLLDWITDQTSSKTPSVALEAWRLYQNMRSNSRVSYSSKIYPLIPPYLDEEPLVDIIFIHGIKGGASWTWRQHDSAKERPMLHSDLRNQILSSSDEDSRNNVLDNYYTWIWPLDWVRTSIKRPARLLALDYPADWRKERNNTFQIDHNLDDLSQEVMQDLIEAGVGSRPIIWVTHSLGGLLIKNIFHTASKAKEKESLDLCCSTKGIVFYSVPHFGSPLCAWTYLFSCVFKPSSLVYCMTSDKSYLLNLHESFVKTCDEHSIEVLSINETKPASITSAGPKILFVHPESGNPGIGAFHGVDSCHLDVCKPMDRHSPGYAIMEEFVLKLVQSLPQ